MTNGTTIEFFPTIIPHTSRLLWKRKTKNGITVQREERILDSNGTTVDAKAFFKAETDGHISLKNYFKAVQQLEKKGYKICPEETQNEIKYRYRNDRGQEVGDKSEILKNGTKIVSKDSNGIYYKMIQQPNAQKWSLDCLCMPGLSINNGEITNIEPKKFNKTLAKMPKTIYTHVEKAIKNFGKSLTEFELKSALERITK